MKSKMFMYLSFAVVLISLFVVASVFYKTSQEQKISFLNSEYKNTFVRDHSPRYGNENAKVMLIEFLDPECESCRTFYPIVKSLISEYEDKVQLVVRYAPFHANSKTAIKALEASRMQGQYWEALELLFEHQPKWGDHHNPKPELIFDYLSKLEIDMNRLKADMGSPSIEEIISTDERDLKIIGVRGTPTFFVNGKPLQSFSVDALQRLLKEEVDKAYP